MAFASPYLSSMLLQSCFFLYTVFVHSVASLNATCYFPDGSVAPSDTPCPNIGSSASCCGQDSYCLSNGLCAVIFRMSYARGSCTDPTWKAIGCPNVCLGGESSFFYPDSILPHRLRNPWPGLAVYATGYPALGYSCITETSVLRCRAASPSGGGPIFKCDYGSLFSCEHQTCATDNFSMPDFGKVQVILRDYQLSSLGLHSSSSIAISTDSAMSSASTDTQSTPTGSTTVSVSPTETKDATPTASTAVRSSNHSALAIGLGTGIPVGLVALAGLTVLILARRKINILTKGIEKSQADLLAYKDAQRGYEQTQSQTTYEAPFNGVNPELSSGRDFQQLPS